MYIFAGAFLCKKRTVSVCISAWASALLVHTVSGNAKASMRGTGDRYRFSRSFCLVGVLNYVIIPVRESAGNKNLVI